MTGFKHYILQLNLFSHSLSDDQDENIFQQQTSRIITRIYVISFTLLLLTFALATSLPVRSEQIEVQSPSLFQYENLPFDTVCLCNESSVSYSAFLSTSPSFHQVCSSILVSDSWIASLYFGNQQGTFENDDFRSIAFSFFQTLSILCNHSRVLVNDTLTEINSQSILGLNLLSKSNFYAQVSADTERFRTNTMKSLQSELQVINRLIAGSFLLNTLQTSIVTTVSSIYRGYLLIENRHANLVQKDGSLCDCTTSFSCEGSKISLPISNDTFTNEYFVIPGLKLRCMPFDTCLHSTLECFYNQTCVDRMLVSFPTALNYTAMVLLESSRFQITTAIQLLASQLMVEDWGFNATYEKYFDRCAPKSCHYSAGVRANFLFVVGYLIGLLTGLHFLLKFLLATVFRFICLKIYMRKKMKVNQTSTCQTRAEKVHQVLRKIQNAIIKFNIFKNSNENEAEHDIHYQQIATRLYFSLLAITLCAITFYTSINMNTYVEEVIHPSESTYFQLQSIYSSSLRCLCSQQSISYDRFLALEPIYHQLCSSKLVSSEWINLLRENYRPPPFGYGDLFSTGAGLFQLLATFCETANITNNDSLENFLHRKLVTTAVIPKDYFEALITSEINEWRTEVSFDFLQIFYLFRTYTQDNTLLSQEYNFMWYSGYFYTTYLYFNFHLIGDVGIEICKCDIPMHCSQNLPVFSPEINLLVIKDFVIACTPVNSLLLSNLQAFYNSSFINDLYTYFAHNTKNFSLQTLNDSNNNPTNETIQSIARRSFVDRWTDNTSFVDYYRGCAPRSCTYEVVRRPYPLSIVSSFIAAYGGLSTSLKILMIIVLWSLRKFRNNLPSNMIRAWFKSFSDERHLSARLKVILISITLIVLYFSYASRRYRVTVELATYPSHDLYSSLLSKYPTESLYCPCSQVSIPYRTFVNISTVTFHQICSREFLSDSWLRQYLSRTLSILNNPSPHSDFILAYFQIITALCQLSRDSVDNSLLKFLSSSLIQTNPNPSSEDLRLTMRIRIIKFKTEMSLSLIRTLGLLREITHINQLITIFRSDWNFLHHNLSHELVNQNKSKARMISAKYEDCDCALSKRCMEPMMDEYGLNIIGLVIACYPFEGILQSTLECFYDAPCFQSMVGDRVTYDAVSSLILNVSLPSRYSPENTFATLFNNLFIEDWSSNISYENYYKTCAPSSCSYTYFRPIATIEIITDLLGLYGGLTIIISCLIVPSIIKITRLFKKSIPRIDIIND